MDIEEITGQATDWKQKYLSKLEETERSQRAWKAAEEMLRHAITRLSLAAQGLDPELDQQLTRVRAAIRDRVDNQQLGRDIESLSDALVHLDRKRSDSANDDVNPTPKKNESGGLLKRMFKSDVPPREPTGALAAISADRLLLDLLDRLQLPDYLKDRATLIREQIDTGLLLQDWPLILEEIAGLIDALRNHARQDHADLELFLTRVGERLEEMDQQLTDSVQSQAQGRGNRQHLDDGLKREMRSIETSVQGAVDIEALKTAVQSRLDLMLEQLASFTEAEDQRFDEGHRRLSGLQQRIKTLEQEADTLREEINVERVQATTDSLTDIPNRLAFERRLNEEIARWKRFSTPLILMIWDVDFFKNVNDKFGHKAGDKVLRKIAQVFYSNIRETDFVARYGGEEFVMLMTGSPIEASLEVADKLRAAVEMTGFHFRDESITITVSCGLVEFNENDTPELLFERADRALYRAKEMGRNRCECG